MTLASDHSALFADIDFGQLAAIPWLQATADVGRVGFWRFDIATEEFECTPMCRQNLGFEAGEKFDRSRLRARLFPEDTARADAVIARAIEERSEYWADYRIVWPDKSVHWIAARGKVVDGGTRGIIVGLNFDMTDFLPIHDELAQQQNLNRTITTHVAEGIAYVDESGRLTFMNPAAEAILGRSEAELRGQVFHDVVHNKHRDGSTFPASECPLWLTLLSGEKIKHYDDAWIRSDGSFVEVRCSSTPISHDGSVIGAVLSVHDITEQKRLEAALREANRTKDEFLATVSHELRTPMTAILGWVGYLRMVPLDAEVEQVLKHLEQAAKSQAAIVDDLLDVSRAATGKLYVELAPVNLQVVVDAALRTIEPTARTKNLSLITTPPRRVVVSADESRLRQVFVNLLSNAVKFTPEGGRIEVSVTSVEGRATVAVRDSGIGMDLEFVAKAFDRFTQAGAVNVRHSGGLGLGLAIAKQIVELHGGTIAAHSDGPGTGATFTVSLPRLV